MWSGHDGGAYGLKDSAFLLRRGEAERREFPSVATTSEGKRLIALLKQHILEQMRSEPTCGPDAAGLGNVEVEELCGLSLYLDSQDHYLTYSLLCSLIKDDAVERVVLPKSPRRPKYRLRDGGAIPIRKSAAPDHT